jgi:hypothetical protein
MDDSGHVSETEIKELVYSFCQALSGRNLEKIESFLADQSSLSWGPYNFIGKESILNWAKELNDLFPFMAFKEKAIEVHGSTAKHEFMIAFLTSRGRKGWLPCEGVYDFVNNQIVTLKVKLLHGFLTVSRDDVERVKPHATK